LMQNRGKWENTTLLGDTAYYSAMINPSQDLNPSYGYLWWLNGQDQYIGPGSPITINSPLAPDAPSDVYTAAGSQGQLISIAPSTGLIMVRQGLQADASLVPISLHNEIWKRIGRLDCLSTAVEDNNLAPVQVYPNPTTGAINITGLMATIKEVQVHNQLGRLVKNFTGASVLSIQDLPAGIYYLTINTRLGSLRKRVVKH